MSVGGVKDSGRFLFGHSAGSMDLGYRYYDRKEGGGIQC